MQTKSSGFEKFVRRYKTVVFIFFFQMLDGNSRPLPTTDQSTLYHDTSYSTETLVTQLYQKSIVIIVNFVFKNGPPK